MSALKAFMPVLEDGQPAIKYPACEDVLNAVKEDGQTEEVQELVRQSWRMGHEHGVQTERGRFGDDIPPGEAAWKDRALRAEKQIDMLLGRFKVLEEESRESIEPKKEYVYLPTPTRMDEDKRMWIVAIVISVFVNALFQIVRRWM